jgi:hypothetical protein
MLDIAPTLLELGGYDIPTSMQGKSLMAGQTIDPNARGGISGSYGIYGSSKGSVLFYNLLSLLGRG